MSANRGIWVALGLIAACACAGLVVLAAVGLTVVVMPSDAGLPRPAPAVTALPGPTVAPPSASEPAPAIDEAALAVLDEIERQVVELRGLGPRGTFELEFPTYEEYRQITIDDLEAEYSREEALDDARLLTALGLMPDGFDLYQLYVDLYSENVLGSYDQDTQEMYVLLVSGGLGGVERQTYAHEFVHALQDQNYGLEALGLSDEGCEQDSERCAGLRGLVEGDATILETQWLEQFGTSQDYDDIAEFYQGFSSPAYERAPCYLRDDFYWPYDDGAKFVQGLFDAGGWQAVDQAYLNPPVSTEQVIHPGLFHAGDQPEVLPAPVVTATLGGGWRQVDANVMGEWYTRLILLEPFRESDRSNPSYCAAEGREASQMAEAAAGWGGDAYAAFHDEATGGTVLALLTTWDSPGEADEFADAFGDYSDARFGAGATERGGGECWEAGGYGLSCLVRRETDTLWVMAPDEAMVDRVVAPIFGGGP